MGCRYRVTAGNYCTLNKGSCSGEFSCFTYLEEEPKKKIEPADAEEKNKKYVPCKHLMWGHYCKYRHQFCEPEFEGKEYLCGNCEDYSAIDESEVQERPKYCKYCFNARVWEPTDEEIFNPYVTYLTDENDGSACGVGTRTNEHDMMICSGMGRPVRIEFRQWYDAGKYWITVGEYLPKFCPECGRRLDEYDNKVN